MFKLEIKFEDSNASFDVDNYELEVGDILDTVVEKFKYGYTSGNLKDSNGNTVGSWNADLGTTPYPTL
jgi:hypothetical protein